MASVLVKDILPPDQYVASAAQEDFTVTFSWTEDTDVVLYIDGVVSEDFTLARATPTENGGTLSLDTPATGGEIITIDRDTPVKRLTNFTDSGSWNADNVNNDFNNLVRMIQEFEAKTDRSLRFSSFDYGDQSSPNFDPVLPPLEANKVLLVNSTGDGFEFSTNDLTNIEAYLAILAPISASIVTVAGIPANVTTVAGISANVTTVAGISANVTTVAGISANVTTVAGISANVTTVAGISANVTTLSAVAAGITTLAALDTEIAALAALDTEIAALGAITSDITDAANNIPKANRSATAAPTVNDDTGDDYSPGSLWVDVTNDDVYMCVDATLGAAVWEQIDAPASAGWVLIETQIASNDSSVDFTTGIDGTYKIYAFTFAAVIPQTDNIDLDFRLGNGGVFDSGSGNYSYTTISIAEGSGSAFTFGGTASATFIKIGDVNVGNGAAEGESGVFFMYDPANANRATSIKGDAIIYDAATGVPHYVEYSGTRLENAAHDRAQFLYPTGNIASGVFSLYGLRGS